MSQDIILPEVEVQLVTAPVTWSGGAQVDFLFIISRRGRVVFGCIGVRSHLRRRAASGP